VPSSIGTPFNAILSFKAKVLPSSLPPALCSSATVHFHAQAP
jgi:hypothetical protein